MHYEQQDGQFTLTSLTFRVVWRRQADGWRDRLEIPVGEAWRVISETTYHAALHDPQLRQTGCYLFQDVRLEEPSPGCARVAASLDIPGFGTLRATYELEDTGLVRIAAELNVTAPRQCGGQFFRFHRPAEYDRVRMHDLAPAGWSNADGSIVFHSTWLEDFPNHQMSLAQVNFPNPDDQAMGLIFPPGYARGFFDFQNGQRISGNISACVGRQDIFSERLEIAPGKIFAPPATIAPPRYSYREYIRKWVEFIRRPELWVDLGEGMGLFHRGFCRMITLGTPKHSGVLRYTKNPNGTLHSVTEHDRLIELAWGGVANVALAETLWMLAQAGFWDDGAERCRQMIKAILEFRDGGFQVKDGPCRGAWWNGYIVERDQFASRYGRPHVETPNQGTVNYFLYRLSQHGLADPKVVAERIRYNCVHYLRAMRRDDGGIEFGRYIDGRMGENRQFTPYIQGYAAGTAMAGLSWLCAYRLTGDRTALQESRSLFDHLVHAELSRNEWRFLEYDSTGMEISSVVAILMALCEAIKDMDEPSYREAANRSFEQVRTFQIDIEPNLDRYRRKEAMWGGTMRVKGGITFGSSAGHRQGNHCIHNRYDIACGLQHYYDLTGSAAAYASLIDYLNYLTHHQWTNRDLPIGYGAMTEGCALDWHHVKDTAQIKHSMPLTMLSFIDDLQLTGSNTVLTDIHRPAAGQLTIRLERAPAGPCWLSFDRPVRVVQGRNVLWSGPGECVVLADVGEPLLAQALRES